MATSYIVSAIPLSPLPLLSPVSRAPVRILQGLVPLAGPPPEGPTEVRVPSLRIPDTASEDNEPVHTQVTSPTITSSNLLTHTTGPSSLEISESSSVGLPDTMSAKAIEKAKAREGKKEMSFPCLTSPLSPPLTTSDNFTTQLPSAFSFFQPPLVATKYGDPVPGQEDTMSNDRLESVISKQLEECSISYPLLAPHLTDLQVDLKKRTVVASRSSKWNRFIEACETGCLADLAEEVWLEQWDDDPECPLMDRANPDDITGDGDVDVHYETFDQDEDAYDEADW
jgi:hypothetical protein